VVVATMMTTATSTTKAVLWLRQSVTGFLPQRPGLNLGASPCGIYSGYRHCDST